LGPTCQPPFSPFLFFFPLLAGRHRSRVESAAPPPSPLPFFPMRARQLRQLIPHSNPRPFPLFPLPSLRPDGPLAINGKPPAAPSPSRFAFLPAPLFKLTLDRLRLPLPSQHTYSLARAQFPSAAASGPRRRYASAAVGEGPPPPPPFTSLWVHQRLNKRVLLQVHVLDASRSPFTVRRSAAGIAVDAGPLLRFSFRSHRRCSFYTPR
jgi:hypothetical protein